MSEKKYIVTNCPGGICYFGFPKELMSCFDSSINCQDRKDCSIKKIIEICKREYNNPFELPILDEDERIHKCGKNEIAREILKNFEIVDIDNE